MAPTMAEQITAILADFTAVLGAIVGGIGDIATFVMTNPLLVIAISFTLVGVAFQYVRSFIRN